MDLKLLGDRLRVIRTQRGLSQYNMADELGISDVAYSKIERGLTNVSIERLDQIAKCLHVTIDKFLIDSDLVDLSRENDRKTQRQTESLIRRIRDLEIKVEYVLKRLEKED